MRGLFALLFGVATIVWPDVTLTTLVLLVGGYAVADGTLSLIGLFDHDPATLRWKLARGRIVSIVAGLLTLLWPGLTP